MRIINPVLAGILVLCACSPAYAQSFTPGKIIRAATGSGATILDPNADGYVSSGTSGFSGNLDTGSAVNEVYYQPIKANSGEPHSDLRRGADHRFSDFVPDASQHGVYLNWLAGGSDATTYLRIRMRMGTVIPGSKGFSLLIDTDNKYGANGSSADPNYVAKTTGINGNPGFELELVLETGFRLAIYNIDGKGNPSDNIDGSPAVTHTNWQDHSQVSMAATTDGGDPDFFLDWYVSLADLKSVTATNSQTVSSGTSFISSASQNVRIIPTTVMAPKPSTAGPVSDIYGSNDSTTISWQPATGLISPRDSVCTKAPVINSATFASGTTTIEGSWSKDVNSSSNTAIITIYKSGNSTPITTTVTVNANTGSSWSASTTALIAGDVITARAQGSGKESNSCFASDAVNVKACAIRQSPLMINDLTNKGISGTGYTPASNRFIKVYHITASAVTLVGTPTSAPVDSSTVGNSNGFYSYTSGSATGLWQFSKGAQGSGPSANLNPGSYMVIDSNSTTGCTSGATFFCASFSNNGTPKTAIGAVTQQPTITSPASGITTATTAISGSFKVTGTTAGSVRIYVDSSFVGSATVAGGNWSYTFPNTALLKAGKIIRVRAIATETTASSTTTYYCAADTAATIAAVVCSNAVPVIDVDPTTSKLIPGNRITGTGTAGGSVKIYNATNQLKETVTVGTDGTWTSSFAAATGDNSYYVTLSTIGCTNVATSVSKQVSTQNTPATYCDGYVYTSTNGQVSGPMGVNTILYSNETSLHGTLSSSGGLATSGTFVKLYVDSVVVGNATVNTANNTWGPIDVSSILYQGAVVTVGVVQSGSFGEYVCSSFKVTCACALQNMPEKPVVDPSSITAVAVGGKPTIVVKNPVAGNFYSVRDSITYNSLSRGIYYVGGNQSVIGRIMADSTLSITTSEIYSNTTAQVVATKVGGTESCTDTTYENLSVFNVLPIQLVAFQGTRKSNTQELVWTTGVELNFSHFELERSTNGLNYARIASIAGSGNDSHYAYTDNAAGPVLYYRLKMVDADGRIKFSNVIVLRDNGASITGIAARPNPFQSRLTISIHLANTEQVKLMMVDAAGRVVYSATYTGAAGSNYFPVGNLDRLAPGFYVMKIIANGTVFQEPLVKTNN